MSDEAQAGLKNSLPVRFVLIVVSTTVCFWLGILGWGGFAAFFSHPALGALAVATGVLALASLFAGGNISSGVREDRGNRWVLIVFVALALLDTFLPAYTDRKGFWTIGGDLVRWMGVALFLVGGLVRLWPVFVLGDRFSGLVAIQKGHELVTAGVYRFIRNPSYLGLLIYSLGWALAFRSGVGVLIAVLYIPPLVARMGSEERLLESQFGAEYATYRARTWRLVPWVY